MVLRPQTEMIEFYESCYVEAERLRRTPHGRLEFARTQELRVAGFGPVDVFGVEGPLCAALDVRGMERIDDMLPAAVECARLVEQQGPIIGASPHMVAVARVATHTAPTVR